MSGNSVAKNDGRAVKLGDNFSKQDFKGGDRVLLVLVKVGFGDEPSVNLQYNLTDSTSREFGSLATGLGSLKLMEPRITYILTSLL